MVSFDAIWARIKHCEGQTFQQIRGREFSYAVDGSVVIPSTTNQNIPRSHVEEASKLVPLSNTVPVQHLRGPSYIYAILNDKRIRQTDW